MDGADYLMWVGIEDKDMHEPTHDPRYHRKHIQLPLIWPGDVVFGPSSVYWNEVDFITYYMTKDAAKPFFRQPAIFPFAIAPGGTVTVSATNLVGPLIMCGEFKP